MLRNSSAVSSLGDIGGRVARGTLTGLSAGQTAAVMRGGRMSVVQVAGDAFGNALGGSLVEVSWGTGSPYVGLEAEQDLGHEARRYAGAGDPTSQLEMSGSGLRVSREQVNKFGPQFASEYDYLYRTTGYDLLAEEQSVRLSTMTGEASPQQTMRDWDPYNEWDKASAAMAVDLPLAGLKEDYLRGYNDPRGMNRSVMDGPVTSTERIGRLAGGTVDAFTDFGMSISGARSMNDAEASWRAGNYGLSVLHRSTAFGEAGMTVLSLGTASTARYGGTMTAQELAAARGSYAASLAHPLEGATTAELINRVQALGLHTSRDELLLRSGLGRGREGIVRSQSYALENGGRTLEMTRGGGWVDEMNLYGKNSPFTQTEADHIWGATSRYLAQQASGQVRALQGSVRPSSFYRRIEFPELLVNPNVTGIESLYLKPRYSFGGK